MRYGEKGKLSMNLRDDLLPWELTYINDSLRCEACNHLVLFHHADDEESFCVIEDCNCYCDKGKWVLENERKER